MKGPSEDDVAGMSNQQLRGAAFKDRSNAQKYRNEIRKRALCRGSPFRADIDAFTIWYDEWERKNFAPPPPSPADQRRKHNGYLLVLHVVHILIVVSPKAQRSIIIGTLRSMIDDFWQFVPDDWGEHEVFENGRVLVSQPEDRVMRDRAHYLYNEYSQSNGRYTGSKDLIEKLITAEDHVVFPLKMHNAG